MNVGESIGRLISKIKNVFRNIFLTGWDCDAYQSMCENVEYWKSRALDSESTLEKIRIEMSPTYMGEPSLVGSIQVPEGWKLVPIKEDVEMRSAGFSCCDVTTGKVVEIWSAMVNAAPSYGSNNVDLKQGDSL